MYGNVEMYKIDNKKRSNFLVRTNPGNRKQKLEIVGEKTRGVKMSRSKIEKENKKMQEKEDNRNKNHCNKRKKENS